MAAAKTFNLDIVTPSSNLFSGEVESVTAPGTQGYFQVLANHTPFLASLQIGHIKVKTPENTLLYATSGGFAEVADNKVSIIAESAELSSEIDKKRAEEAIRRAEERLSDQSDDLDVDRVKLALYRSINRLKISGRGRGSGSQ